MCVQLHLHTAQAGSIQSEEKHVYLSGRAQICPLHKRDHCIGVCVGCA